MKKISKNRFKRHSQIFNLKGILNNVNNESSILISKITELQKIFKNTKKIIKEKINELAKLQKNQITINEDQIKQQICTNLNNVIKKYNEGKTITSINSKKEEYKKLLKEKTINLHTILKKLKYRKLQKEKDLLIQTIQEKKNICEELKRQIEYEKDLSSIFQPRNFIFFDNIYNFNNEKLKINLKKPKKKKIKELQNQARLNLKEKVMKYVNVLKENKKNYISNVNDYIKDKGFDCTFDNKRYKEKYNIEIELINEYGYSSDSEYDTEEEESKNNINYVSNDNLNFIINNEINVLNKNLQKKKISLSSSEKETNDQEKEKEKEKETKSNDTLILINKLVELKEKYNKLMNERFEYDAQKNSLKKKITKAKDKIGRNAYSSSSLSIKNAKNINKIQNEKFSYFNKNKI